MSASHLQAIHDVCHISRVIPSAVYIQESEVNWCCFGSPRIWGSIHPVLRTVTQSPHGKRIAIIIPLYEMHQNTVRTRFLAEANTFLHSRGKGHWNILSKYLHHANPAVHVG